MSSSVGDGAVDHPERLKRGSRHLVRHVEAVSRHATMQAPEVKRAAKVGIVAQVTAWACVRLLGAIRVVVAQRSAVAPEGLPS